MRGKVNWLNRTLNGIQKQKRTTHSQLRFVSSNSFAISRKASAADLRRLISQNWRMNSYQSTDDQFCRFSSAGSGAHSCHAA